MEKNRIHINPTPAKPVPQEQKIEVASPTPYPPVTVEASNRQYAQLLRYDLASSHSEFTSLAQYIYQSWILEASYPQIAETMRRIAVVEMRHLDMIGKLILLLGGVPIYSVAQNNRNVAWNGGMVQYQGAISTCMKNNIVMERTAIDHYQKQMAKIKDECVRAVLSRIVLDEEIHIQIFSKFLEEQYKPPHNLNR